MQIITSIVSDFDQLVRSNDWEIISRFLYYCRTTEKRMIPKSVDGIGQKIDRVFAETARHTDGRVTRQTLPGALEWLWADYSGK